jgi:hypothetical protein
VPALHQTLDLALGWLGRPQGLLASHHALELDYAHRWVGRPQGVPALHHALDLAQGG